ncbi:MAG: hypothetical protein ABSG33_06735 [Candidatus Bathyarchaeia archaeon]|jgi:hypothetical protein
MPKTIAVLEVDDPHFTIKLSNSLLKIDLKGSFKNELEEAIENKPGLKETVGRILSIFVPLHIRISDIHSVHMDENGKINLRLSHQRNVVIPLERKEDAEKLLEKLNELTSKALDEKIKEGFERRRAKRRSKRKSKGVSPSSYGTVPYYFPTEQVDIVDKFKRKRKKQQK